MIHTMTDQSQEEHNEKNALQAPVHQPFAPIQTHELSCIKASFSTKASPFLIKSWITMSLTLNGRDKITKVIQYSSRLLGFYYESVAANIKNGSTTNIRQVALFLSKAKRFRNLQKTLTKSRKAYRLGRSIIEIEKLANIGFVHWIAWYLRQHLFSPSSLSSLTADESKHGSIVSWHPDTKFDSDACGGTKQQNVHSEDAIDVKEKSDASPPRIRLPRRVSSNLGPNIQVAKYPQLSSMSRFMYRSLSTFIDEARDTSKEVPPAWKIILSTFKLLGLAGFWAGDNVSFLYSSGFLVGQNELATKSRTKSASLFAARSYFFASVSGLYLNAKEFFRHRNGPLKEATTQLNNCRSRTDYEERDLLLLEAALEKAKEKHASLTIALLKVSSK